MKILQIRDLKKILDDFNASEPKQDTAPREEELSYIGSLSSYFFSGQQAPKVESPIKPFDRSILKVQSIYAEAKSRTSDEASWLPADLVERFCNILSDKQLDDNSVAGRAIFSEGDTSGMRCRILAVIVRQNSFEISMLQTSDFSYKNVGFLWTLESLFFNISKMNYQMSCDELGLILKNLNSAVALVVCFMALDRAPDKQVLKAAFIEGFNEHGKHFIGHEQMLLNMFIHDNPRYLKPLYGIPAAIDMITKSCKPLSVDDLHCLLAYPQYAHIYANAINELYASIRYVNFKDIVDDMTRKMQERPERAHSLCIIVKNAICFQSGRLQLALDELDKLDDEHLNAFAFMLNKMHKTMRTSAYLSILLAHVRSADMCEVAYLCNMLELFTKLFQVPENAFDKMINNLPFAAQYFHLPKILDDGERYFAFLSPLHLSLDIIFENPASASSRITSLFCLLDEYKKFKQIGTNHEMVPYLTEARDAIFKNPEVAEALSQRVCLQARNWSGCFPLTPIEKIVNELTQTRKVRHSPTLFALQAARVEDKSAVVTASKADEVSFKCDVVTL